MKIYTRKGDRGTTGLLGGTRVPKHHLRIEAYGTVDELNSHLGLLRDSIAVDNHRAMLLEIQNLLFVLGSHLATDPTHAGKMKLPELNAAHVERLETEMDRMDSLLPEMKNFIIPGGHTVVSQAHVARCVCRRAERCTTALSEIEVVNALHLQYLNRLSDYLFVLARMLAHELKVEEIPWRSTT